MLGWRRRQAGLEPREEAVRRYVLTQYPLLGRAPTCQEMAAALGLDEPDRVRATLERLHALDLLDLDPGSGEIRLAYPFSTVPTKHRVQFCDWAAAKPVYAPCAVDALGITFLLNRDLSLRSACGTCGMPIAIDVRDGRIASHTPIETVVWMETAYSGRACTSVCPTIDFFCSSAHATAWWQARPHESGYVLSLGEALYLSREIFVDLLKRQPDLSSSNITAVSPPGRGNTAIAASSIGSLVTAFLASVCCIGSVVFAALGVGVGATGFLASTAGFLKALVPYRPLFMGLTAVLLGVSLYLAYRKPRAVCVPEAVCVPCAASRVNRTVLWLMAILAVVLILAPYWLEWVTGS